MAGDGEVVLHDERDHLRGVLGGIDVPRQSEGYKYSFMNLKYIFILFDYFCTLWQYANPGSRADWEFLPNDVVKSCHTLVYVPPVPITSILK